MLEDLDLLEEEVCTSSSDAPPSGGEAAEAAQADVHGVLLQLRREWSEEGAVERHQSFDPILEALARVMPFDRWSAGNRGAAGGAAGGDSHDWCLQLRAGAIPRTPSPNHREREGSSAVATAQLTRMIWACSSRGGR